MSDTNLPTVDQNRDLSAPESPGFGSTDVKELGAVDASHHAVQEIGTSVMKKETTQDGKAAEFLSEFIYEHDKAWVREWLQNHESAIIRRAKFLVKISDEYPDGWLKIQKWVDGDGEVVEKQEEVDEETRVMEVARPIDEVLEAARNLGYDPTIVWDIYRDERQIITEDNGDGMTPTEFDEHFNTVFGSGSKFDSETGGMIGIGSESSAIVHGKEGGMEVETRSTHPDDNGNIRRGFRAYSYLGGGNILPGDVEDGFIGTRFKIPVKESFSLGKLQGWVEEYADKLRVPLLYREHDSGITKAEEEYEACTFAEDYDNPPVVIDQPGEFTVCAGPDVVDTGYGSDDNDTFLISMPIDRNTRYNIRTFWSVAIQIHDEQGRIIAGPNRGRFEDEVDLHDDDIVLPQPTGDRDRLQKTDQAYEFFEYIQEQVKSKELDRAAEVVDRMKDADHPGHAIRSEERDWDLFDRMVNYYGSHNTTDSRRAFKDFIESRAEFPALEDPTISEIYDLFREISHCTKGPNRSSKKSNRSEKKLGDFLANHDPDATYMAASTGGNFSQYFKVVENTYDDVEVLVVSGSNRYSKFQNRFGFKILKDVPLTDGDDDDHDFDVPDYIHDDNIKVSNGSSGGVPDAVGDRTLKIRSDADNSSIDVRYTVDEVKSRLEDGNSIGGESKLILFPRSGEENISDHYDMAEYAAIVSVTQKEYDALIDYDQVFTFDEYKEWSQSALIATEDGAMQPGDLLDDDRMVILAYRPPKDHDVVKLLADEHEELRQHYMEDIRDQLSWYYLDEYDVSRHGEPDEADKPDLLFAVAGSIVLSRAEWAFEQHDISKLDMTGLKLSRRKYGYKNPCAWKSLNGSTTTYRLMVDTPNWDDDSEIYDVMPNDREKRRAQIYLGFHDVGIDPTKHDPATLREFIKT